MQRISSSTTARIALVTGGVKLGGSTTFLINFAGELVRRGIPVEVMSFERENPMAADFQRLNISVQYFDDRRNIFEDRMRAVLGELRCFQPTVVVANLAPPSFETLRYLPAGVFRIGVGQADHSSTYEMMRHYAPHMDLLAVVSETMKRKAEVLPEFARVPVAYLRHGVPMPLAADLPVRDRSAPQRILYLGRLVREEKRVHLFPEILSQLCASGMPFHWTIAGDGEERGFLEAKLKPVSPSQTVSIIGPVRYADVPALLKQHDICLLTSDHEGFGLSVLEAMGYGLVPVVSDLPAGIPEMVDKTTGILVPADDVAGYARAIIHLHEHRDELAAKSAAARVRVQKEFMVEAMTDRWLAVFPKNPPVISVWPTDWNIKPPLVARHPIYFSPPMRMLRRLAAKFRR
jgi:glycosyltransferase involved in cell wall biosynthesis